MATLYLVRHCEAQGNIHKRMHGVCDTDITPKGAKQLECLKERFQNMPIHAVYSSTLMRAVKTAQAIAASHGLPVRQVRALCERNLGIFEDRSWHELKRNEAEAFTSWRNDLFHYRIAGGESEQQSLKRFRSALVQIARENVDETVAVVAHSMVIKTFLEHEAYIDQSIPYGDNTSVSRLLYDGDEDSFRADFINDAGHLPPTLSSFARETWWKNAHSIDEYGLRFERQRGERLPDNWPEFDLEEWSGYERDEFAGSAAYQMVDKQCQCWLYVPKEKRNRGFGTQLLGQVIVEARTRNANQVVLKTEGSDESIATGFCKKNGFQRSDEGVYWLPIKLLRREVLDCSCEQTERMVD